MPRGRYIAHNTHLGAEFFEYITEKYAELYLSQNFDPDPEMLDEENIKLFLSKFLDNRVLAGFSDTEVGIGYIIGFIECAKSIFEAESWQSDQR